MREFIDYPGEVPQIAFEVAMGNKYVSADFDILGYTALVEQSGIRADRVGRLAVRFCSIQGHEASIAETQEGEAYLGEYRTNRFPKLPDEPTSIINIFYDSGSRNYEFNKTLIHETGHYIDDVKGRRAHRMFKRRSFGVEMPRAVGSIFFKTALKIFGCSYEELDDFAENENLSWQPHPMRAKLAMPFLYLSDKVWDVQQKINDSPKLARLHYKFSYAEFKARRFTKKHYLRASIEPFIRSQPKN